MSQLITEDPSFPRSPSADRLTRSRWLDLRLAIGLLLVLGSVVAGSRLVATADDTVLRLAASTDLQPGMQLTDERVVERRVRLGEVDSAYVAGPIPSGYVVVRPVTAGELLPRAAVAPATSAGPTRYLTLAVPDAELPGSLTAGDRVDVWTLPAADRAPSAATLTVAGVTVVDTGDTGGPFGGSGVTRAVTLALRQDNLADQAFQDRLATLIAAARAGAVYLTAWPDDAQDPR